MKSQSPLVDRAFELARIEFEPSHAQPSAVHLAVATAIALVGSLLADAALVAVGIAMFPAKKGYAHFQFADYAKLTIIGVLIACVAWPIVTRITSAPRWMFFRLSILVSAVLFLPDVWLLYKGQSGQAVGVLVVMHIAIAVVTYNALVRVAPAGETKPPRRAANRADEVHA